MTDFLKNLFSSSGFMPHGHCFLWQPGVLWLHVISDGFIALAYFSIPVTLLYLLRKSKDVPAKTVVALFSAFILSCGLTHVLSIYTFWVPVYRIDGLVKALTAVLSVVTAIATVYLIPRLLALRSPVELEQINKTLLNQIEETKRARDERDQFFAVSPDMFCIAGPDHKFRKVNRSWTDVLGYSESELLNTPFLSFVHPDDLEATLTEARACLTQPTVSFINRYRHKDGSYRWISWRSTAVGELIYAAARDITQERENEQKLLAAAKRQSEVIVANTDAVIFSFGPDGIFTFSDGKGLQALGLKPGQRVGQSIFEVYAQSPEVLSSVRDALKGNGGSVTTHVKPSHWYEVHFNPVFENGEVQSVVGVAYNVTSRVQSQRALAESRRKLKTVLEHAPVAFWEINQARVFTFREGVGLKSRGLESHQIVGRSIHEVYQDAPSAIHDIERGFKGETFESMGRVGDRSYSLFIAPLRDAAGEIQGVTGFSKDITEQVRAEEETRQLAIREKSALEASKMKSEFLANMSHEIRTPINGIVGMTTLALDTALDDQQRDYLESVRRSADALLHIVNDILDFSKIEAGKMDLEEVDFNLVDLLEDTQHMFAFSAKKKNIDLILEMDLNQSWIFKGDPGRLRQILANLVSNSLKFTAEGSIKIQVVVTQTQEQQTGIRIAITDTGIGIPQEASERIWQAFSQVEASTARRYGGTGLGLSISKRLVELMEGKIGMSSELGRGSTFFFELKLKSGRVSPASSHVLEPLKLAEGEVIRILVAEDNHVNQIIAVKTLEKLGYRATAVGNGKEALDALREVPYDLILMDCQMPEMDGYQATSLIRQSKTLGCNDIPIIAMTANALTGDREKCLAAGMNDYVSKPVSREQLSEVLKKWLSNSPKRSDVNEAQITRGV